MNNLSKKTLVTVLGSSPAVITETLYALKDTTPFPNALCVFTTTHGKKSFEDNDILNVINKLCIEYGLNTFTPESINIHVVTDINGDALPDLRTESDQEAMANFITHEIRQLTSDPDTSIHASIAGGRKSMSFYMGYIFSMFARPSDELSHVLVSTGYEVPGFYYPTKNSFILDSGLDAKDAKVELALIPFIRLNTGLQSSGDLLVIDDNKNPNKLSYSESIAAYQLSLNPQDIRIVLNTQKHEISINDKKLELSASGYAFYRMVLEDSSKDQLSMMRSELGEGKCTAGSRFLEILADMCQYDFKGEVPFDYIDELKDQLNRTNIAVDQKTFNSIEEKGLNSTITDRLITNSKSSIQNICFGNSVDLCKISIVKEDKAKDEPDARTATKSGHYAIRLNPNQISII